MLDKKDTTLIKLDCKSKDKVYDMLFGKADACLKNAKTVALLYLGSPYYMTRALEEYNIEEVNIFTTKDFKFIYEPFENAERVKIWYVDNVKDTFKECDMKFDCIIMNPPYQRNLHLKISAEAIKHLKDDGKCVNLSPVRWLQDPLAKYKKNCDLKRFEESVAKHIESLETITALQAQNIFSGTVMNIDLGVYAYSKANTQFGYKDYYANQILNKCIEYIATHNPNIEADKQDGWRVRMPMILGGKSGGSGDRSKHHKYLSFGKLLMFKDGKNEEGKWWYDCYMHNQYTKTTPYITSSIKFDSKIEAENFINQFDTLFGKYITNLLLSDVHVAPIQVLWLADAVNPLTGKKGYISEWTDDDLYKFFNITPEEQKVIEETMAKYAVK